MAGLPCELDRTWKSIEDGLRTGGDRGGGEGVRSDRRAGIGTQLREPTGAGSFQYLRECNRRAKGERVQENPMHGCAFPKTHENATQSYSWFRTALQD